MNNDMKIDMANETWESELWEDFDTFLAAEKWSDCEAVIEMLGDKGFEGSAIRMNHVLNQAKSLGYLEPVSPEKIPELRAEETDAELFVHSAEFRKDRNSYYSS